MTDVYKLFREHSKGRIITGDGGDLSYVGEVTQGIIDSIYKILESKFKTVWSESSKQKKFMAVMIEALQNIYHHMDSLDSEELKGHDGSLAIFIVEGGKNDIFHIYTGNFISKKDSTTLEERLIRVNKMNINELKEYYRDMLSGSKLSKKGGAGLGIIDIARKSKNKIEYKIQNVSENYSFVSLGITL